MNDAIFCGKLVRLATFDPEHDADLLAKWNRDSEYQVLLDNDPAYLWEPKRIKEWIEKEKNMYMFMIKTLADDRSIGFVDLSGFNWSARHAWVGIGVGEREFWGHGYGTDAMRVVLRFAFQELNLNRVNLSVFEYNERAHKSYLKCGFVDEGRARKQMLRNGKRWDMLFMGILREEWQALQEP